MASGDYHLVSALCRYILGTARKNETALGQALRAVGRGLKVYMAQFIKGQESGNTWPPSG